MTILGSPSWKPKLAAILTPIVPVLLWMVLTTWLKLSEGTATEISGLCMAGLISFGLVNAKQANVSNSPTPLATPQVVTFAPVIAVSPPVTPETATVVVPNPLVPTVSGGHLVE